METPWKVIGAFVGVFIAGAVFGGVLAFAMRAPGRPFAGPQPIFPNPNRPMVQHDGPGPGPGPGPMPGQNRPAGGPQQQPPPTRNPISAQIMRTFTQRLNLTAEQRKKINPIVANASEDLQRLRQEGERHRQQTLAETARLSDRMYRDVAAVLSPEQRDELEEMRKQMLERAERERLKRLEADGANRPNQAGNKQANQLLNPPPGQPTGQPKSP